MPLLMYLDILFYALCVQQRYPLRWKHHVCSNDYATKVSFSFFKFRVCSTAITLILVFPRTIILRPFRLGWHATIVFRNWWHIRSTDVFWRIFSIQVLFTNSFPDRNQPLSWQLPSHLSVWITSFCNVLTWMIFSLLVPICKIFGRKSLKLLFLI